MKNHLKSALTLALLPVVLGATALPQASSKPVKNLQSYLRYDLEGKIKLTCKQTSTLYICESKRESITQVDENNVSSTVSFEKLQLHFNTKLGTQLEKKPFAETIAEMKQTQASSQDVIETPLEDILNRAIVENLTHINLDNLDISNSEPKSHISVKNVTYDNTMTNKAKGVSFKERIFGKVKLRYTQALIDSNDSESFYQNIPQMLEELFETDNKKRADYVSKKLHELYADEPLSSVDGMLVLDSRYIGDDAIALEINATNTNHKNTSGNFGFSGELRQISTFFQPSKGAQSAGLPDFLFKTFQIQSYNKADNYRHLIKSDKKLSAYVQEYIKLTHKHFDAKIKAYTNNAILISWFEDAKLAFSKIIEGKAERLNILINNKNGATAMQLFGIVMGKMMQPPKKGAAQATQEEVIADIATEQLELKIEAN